MYLQFFLFYFNIYTFFNLFRKSYLFLSVFFFWLKIRVSYTLNSWIYTTNHKRIAINYFNFVLVAGTAGMSLATVIRLEFAYPGVGILAGDSLQYLSIATAHGVIMVFFMIMPLIFGAFGNFLLPTQLGVHDVAFPRLNSAAFWFIPGGLIMLCQLVCIDRRYQRMNCFNIRELQGILKKRFFTDLINSNEHHQILSNSIINLRYKLFSTINTNTDIFVFYNLGLINTSLFKNNQLYSCYNWYNLNNQLILFFFSFSWLFSLFSMFKKNLWDIIFNFSYVDFFTYQEITYIFTRNYNIVVFCYNVITFFLDYSLKSFIFLYQALYNFFFLICINFNIVNSFFFFF